MSNNGFWVFMAADGFGGGDGGNTSGGGRGCPDGKDNGEG